MSSLELDRNSQLARDRYKYIRFLEIFIHRTMLPWCVQKENKKQRHQRVSQIN